jgi:hypothetical protein
MHLAYANLPYDWLPGIILGYPPNNPHWSRSQSFWTGPLKGFEKRRVGVYMGNYESEHVEKMNAKSLAPTE